MTFLQTNFKWNLFNTCTSNQLLKGLNWNTYVSKLNQKLMRFIWKTSVRNHFQSSDNIISTKMSGDQVWKPFRFGNRHVVYPFNKCITNCTHCIIKLSDIQTEWNELDRTTTKGFIKLNLFRSLHSCLHSLQTYITYFQSNLAFERYKIFRNS
jgi:hypothetical protein